MVLSTLQGRQRYLEGPAMVPRSHALQLQPPPVACGKHVIEVYVSRQMRCTLPLHKSVSQAKPALHAACCCMPTLACCFRRPVPAFDATRSAPPAFGVAVIADEAHMLKNSRSAQYLAAATLRTKLRFGLSGTVMQVGCWAGPWQRLLSWLQCSRCMPASLHC